MCSFKAIKNFQRQIFYFSESIKKRMRLFDTALFLLIQKSGLKIFFFIINNIDETFVVAAFLKKKDFSFAEKIKAV